MNIIQSKFPEILIIEPNVFIDSRGYFFENYNEILYKNNGINKKFVQDNVSMSSIYVLRGLHFQYPNEQDKLVTVLNGEVLDVIVDIRLGSPTFGFWDSFILNNINKRQIYIPSGFAHGFLSLKDNTIFSYKCSEFYNKNTEKTIMWNDPLININWNVTFPLLSEKDLLGKQLKNYLDNELPKYY